MATLLTLDAAKLKLAALAKPITLSGDVPLSESLGRRLSETLVAPMDLPPFASSAMDGYACRLVVGQKTYLQVGESLAGHPYQGRLNVGECIRILTGAVVPPAADSIIAQEDVQQQGMQIHCNEALSLGRHIRPAGLDVGKGQVLVQSGQRLGATQIALLASAGIASVPCRARIRIALITTGDELMTPPQTLAAGCIYESNLPMLQALLDPDITTLNMALQLKDDRLEIEGALQKIAPKCDVIITNGGISVGETDYVAEIMRTQGELDFWRIALKPGMPMAFGRFAGTLFFGLPGNPVSAYVTFTQLVHPFLVRMAGGETEPDHRFQARLESAIEKNTNRTEFQRGLFSCSPEGDVTVVTVGDQTSNRISSLTQANCFIILKEDEGNKTIGEHVLIQPFGD